MRTLLKGSTLTALLIVSLISWAGIAPALAEGGLGGTGVHDPDGGLGGTGARAPEPFERPVRPERPPSVERLERPERPERPSSEGVSSDMGIRNELPSDLPSSGSGTQ